MTNTILSTRNLTIKKSELNVFNMFQEAMEKLYTLKILNDNDVKRIYQERMSVLQYKLKLYTKDETSSVKYETAINLMKSIDYTISVYLNSLPDVHAIAYQLKSKEICYMTDKGLDLMKRYMKDGEALLQKVSETKIQTENIAYIDTIDYGLPIFFKRYDPFFNAVETDANIDYPIKDINVQYEGCGIIYVMRYMQYLYLENKFIKVFDDKDVEILLKSYDNRYKELLINIYTIVLSSAIGLTICGLNPKKLNLTGDNIKEIQEKLSYLSKDEINKVIYNNTIKCCNDLNIDDISLKQYITDSCRDISGAICTALSMNKLETVFIQIKEEKFIIYKDHKNLSNEKFREIINELYSCSNTEEKIGIIDDSIKSFYDMIDVLESGCILHDEYEIYYKHLDFEVLVLLCKHMDEYDLTKDKECYGILTEFINKYKLNDKINKIKNKILFEE